MGTPTATDTTLGAAQQYVKLLRERHRLDAALKQLKEQLDTLEPVVLDRMSENNTQRVTIDGITLSIRRELWARASSPDAADVLRAAGLGFMAKESINSSTLSAWVRERDANGEPIPEAISAVITVAEVYKLGATSA